MRDNPMPETKRALMERWVQMDEARRSLEMAAERHPGLEPGLRELTRSQDDFVKETEKDPVMKKAYTEYGRRLDEVAMENES